MKELVICSFNVRNDNLVNNLTDDKIKAVYDFLLNDNMIDVLATQEMVSSTLKIVEENHPKYTVVGNYRYNKILRKLRNLAKYNEGTNIVSKYKVESSKTKKLPWFPHNFHDLYKGTIRYKAIVPRISTEIVINNEEVGKIKIISTHLSLYLKSVVRRQLNSLLKEIKESNEPVILLGDFNANIENKMFNKFIEEMKEIGMKRIELNTRTFKYSKKDLAIDHIFVPNNWEVVEKKLILDDILNEYSDHHPLLIKIKPNV